MNTLRWAVRVSLKLSREFLILIVSCLKGVLVLKKYRHYSMIPYLAYIGNIALVLKFRHVEGCVVECGVWKGGMSAGMAEVLGPQRHYYLFDSFEGLPEAQEIDGQSAKDWQSDKELQALVNNCAAGVEYSEEAMSLSPARNVTIKKGWFADTLKDFVPDSPIAILRLDGDWYESTMQCLEALYPHVASQGIVILDDYYYWDGCCKAVHDYLSKNALSDRIRQSEGHICYIVKDQGKE